MVGNVYEDNEKYTLQHLTRKQCIRTNLKMAKIDWPFLWIPWKSG